MQDGRLLRRCGRGEGVGEIALLRAIPRTASIVADTTATVYEQAREPFLTAVLGHAATQRLADDIADRFLTADTKVHPRPHAAGAAD
jgi:CRP-like cAMP-binding protein